MSVIHADGGQVSLTVSGANSAGEARQVHLAARARCGTQDVLIQGWFERADIEDALATSRYSDFDITLEPAA